MPAPCSRRWVAPTTWTRSTPTRSRWPLQWPRLQLHLWLGKATVNRGRSRSRDTPLPPNSLPSTTRLVAAKGIALTSSPPHLPPLDRQTIGPGKPKDSYILGACTVNNNHAWIDQNLSKNLNKKNDSCNAFYFERWFLPFEKLWFKKKIHGERLKYGFTLDWLGQGENGARHIDRHTTM